jgi:hypothetical protein
MFTATTQRGDTVASCGDVVCDASSGYILTGSFQHNPAPEVRREMPVAFNPMRYTWGAANYVVKDGEKVDPQNSGGNLHG